MASYSSGQIVRHLLMRASMGVTLGWFGFLQVRAPQDWVDFVPGVISQVSPVSDTNLILIHGLLLLLSAAGIIIGMYFPTAAGLGVILLVEIIVALALDQGPVNLIVRDIGILGLGIGLAFDNVRFWQLDNSVSRLVLRRAVHVSSSPSA